MNSLKQQLYDQCFSSIETRINDLQHEIHQLQASANEETKSSAGDKYETGRAMVQLEIEKYNEQLIELKRQLQELKRIDPTTSPTVIKAGSLVFTSRGNFYIAVNAGQQQIDTENFFTVSMVSPIAQKLIGLKAEDTFTLNHQAFTIHKIQ